MSNAPPLRRLHVPDPFFYFSFFAAMRSTHSVARVDEGIKFARLACCGGERVGEIGDAAYAPKLISLIDAKSGKARKQALMNAAARLDPAGTLSTIENYLASSSQENREIGADALAAKERPDALPVLVRLLKDSALTVRSSAAMGQCP